MTSDKLKVTRQYNEFGTLITEIMQINADFLRHKNILVPDITDFVPSEFPIHRDKLGSVKKLKNKPQRRHGRGGVTRG